MRTLSCRAMVVAVVLLGLPRAAAAQSTTDTQLWTGAGIELELSERVDLSWEHELRFDDEVGRLGDAFHELAGRYRVADWLRARVGYRYYLVHDGDTAHRVFADATARYRPAGSKWQLQYRLKLQETFRPDPQEDLTDLRNRIEVSARATERVEPYASFELFYRFRDQGDDEFHRYRVTLGVGWEVASRTSLAAYYLFQRELNVNAPERDHVLGVSLGYQIGGQR